MSQEDYVRIKNVQKNPRVPVAIDLARPVKEEGEEVLYEAGEPEEAPVDVRPTDNGDVINYRTRRGQRKMKGRGDTLHLNAMGKDGDTKIVKREVLRAPALRAMREHDLIRVLPAN